MKKVKTKTPRKRSTKVELSEMRKQIAIMLGTGMRVSAIAKLMGTSPSNISTHIYKMKDAGMIATSKKKSTSTETRVTTAALPTSWTLQTPFGSVSLTEGASIKIVGRTAEITW